MRLVLALTPEQVMQVTPHLRPGIALLARLERESFNGSNASTAGTPLITFGSIPTSSLPSLRAAVLAANSPKPQRKKKSGPAPAQCASNGGDISPGGAQ